MVLVPNVTTIYQSHNVFKVNHYKSKYDLQLEAMAHMEQQAIKGPKMTSVTLIKLDNQRSNS